MAEIRVLGSIELFAHCQTVEFGPAKRRAVVAVLAAAAGQPVPIEALIDRVWDDEPPPEARTVLYAHITRIRRLLRDYADSDEPPRLRRRSGGYVLEAGDDQLDLLRFRRIVEQARASDCPDRHRARLLRDALGLWRGRPLTGLLGRWAEQVRESLDQQRLSAAAEWARAELRLGRSVDVIEELSRLLTDYPLAESIVSQLMRALHLDGRTADALSCFATTRERLADMLGARPGAELVAVHRAILSGHPNGPNPATVYRSR